MSLSQLGDRIWVVATFSLHRFIAYCSSTLVDSPTPTFALKVKVGIRRNIPFLLPLNPLTPKS